eukprot:3578231-Pyramimonas_sp.AAC.1
MRPILLRACWAALLLVLDLQSSPTICSTASLTLKSPRESTCRMAPWVGENRIKDTPNTRA